MLISAVGAGAPVEILEAATPHQQTAFVVAAACLITGVNAAGGTAPRLGASEAAPAAPGAVPADRTRPPQSGNGTGWGRQAGGEGVPRPSVAILYRQRRSGRAFQALLRDRGVPFNSCATPPLLTRGARDAAAALLLLAFRRASGALPAGLEGGNGAGACGDPHSTPELQQGDVCVMQLAAEMHMDRELPATTARASQARGVGVPWKRGKEPAWLRGVAGRPGVPHALMAAALRLFRAFLEEEPCMKRTDAGIGSEVRPVLSANCHAAPTYRRSMLHLLGALSLYTVR